MINKIKKRDSYIDKIRPFFNKNIIKVLVGQRRVGKSYILLQIIEELKSEYAITEQQIIFINKELHQFQQIQNHNDLLQYVQQQGDSTKKKYIFVDEIQDIINFEKALRSLQASENFDIYITGSNAHLLSSEIATFLSGRYIEFEIFPLNYNEFLNFHEIEHSKESFFKFMKFGGMPYLKHLQLEEEIIFGYLKSIYNSIVLKDIVQRYAIRNIDFLDKLIFYLADNIGNLFTANNISNYIKSQKTTIGTNVVLEYLKYSTSVYLINQTKRQDILGKKIFEIGEKYYFSDIGLRNMIVGGYKSTDIGKILENIIFLHFKSLGYTIHIGKDKNKEIDFIIEKTKEKKYIQVCYLLESEATKEREFGNLLAIKDNYEKIVLSLDEFAEGEYKGIKHYNIINFLRNSS